MCWNIQAEQWWIAGNRDSEQVGQFTLLLRHCKGPQCKLLGQVDWAPMFRKLQAVRVRDSNFLIIPFYKKILCGFSKPEDNNFCCLHRGHKSYVVGFFDKMMISLLIRVRLGGLSLLYE